MFERSKFITSKFIFQTFENQPHERPKMCKCFGRDEKINYGHKQLSMHAEEQEYACPQNF